MNLEGALTWAFEFEGQPPFAGFRQLASDGLDLPVLNVFRMFGKMSGQKLAVTSSSGFDARWILKSGVRGAPDVSAEASLDKNKLCVLLWHYHDDDVPGPDAQVELNLTGLAIADGPLRAQQFRIDAEHSNAYAAWQRMGQPSQPSPEQYAALEAAGKLAALNQPKSLRVRNGAAKIKLDLPRQAVSLLVLTWTP